MKQEPKESQSEDELSWEVLGTRLRAAREAAGFRQEDLAELVGISRGTVVAIEAGKARVQSLLLHRLATLYRRELGSFFGAPQFVPDLDRLLFERLGPLSPKDRAAIALFLAFCNNLGFVRNLLGPTQPELPPRRTIPPHARKYAAEVAAQEERARLGLGDAPIGEHLVALLDIFGLTVYRASLEDQSIACFLVHYPLSGPVIFVNAAQEHWRQVFTAVHEYGHFLFQHTV
jgi:transcriptional regulator with XRE-family HTH domain